MTFYGYLIVLVLAALIIIPWTFNHISPWASLGGALLYIFGLNYFYNIKQKK